MVEDGYLQTRRGSGTYVTDRALTGRYDLDLHRPWREQLTAQGHGARSQVQPRRRRPVASRVGTQLRHCRGARTPGLSPRGAPGRRHSDRPDGILDHQTGPPHTHAAVHASHGGTASDQRDVIAECFAEIGFATTVQAELLQSYLDIPLIVVHARSVLADTRHLVELSRTSWLASRVRLAYIRNLHLGEIDSMQLLTES